MPAGSGAGQVPDYAYRMQCEPMDYLNEPLVFLDLETTGATPAGDRITEIGLVLVDTNGFREWSRLVNPGTRIPPFIEKLTGITNAMVADAPAFADVADELASLLAGRVVVAHNARFDYAFLLHEFRRVGRTFQAPVLCTVKLSRRLFPEFHRHGLDVLVERHGLTAEGDRHRALTDARLIHCFWRGLVASMDPEVLGGGVRSAMARVALPGHLDPALADELPEAPGTYVFFGEEDVALFVGRAANIRQRVLAHFAGGPAAGRDADLAQRVRRVEWTETGGDLGARLREAVLARQLRPAGRRFAGDPAAPYSWRLADPRDVPLVPELVAAERMDFGGQAGLYGLFKTPGEARRMLAELARGHELCPGLLGLESLLPAEPCSAFKAQRCRGACVGREAPARHGLRLMAALAGLQLSAWPFRGPAMIREGSWAHLADDWRYLGSARDESEVFSLLESRRPPFDQNVYRILSRSRDRLRPVPGSLPPPAT